MGTWAGGKFVTLKATGLKPATLGSEFQQRPQLRVHRFVMRFRGVAPLSWRPEKMLLGEIDYTFWQQLLQVLHTKLGNVCAGKVEKFKFCHF